MSAAAWCVYYFVNTKTLFEKKKKKPVVFIPKKLNVLLLHNIAEHFYVKKLHKKRSVFVMTWGKSFISFGIVVSELYGICATFEKCIGYFSMCFWIYLDSIAKRG